MSAGLDYLDEAGGKGGRQWSSSEESQARAAWKGGAFGLSRKWDTPTLLGF